MLGINDIFYVLVVIFIVIILLIWIIKFFKGGVGVVEVLVVY